ncbi:disulfide-isomerase precursor [Dacryopinax primogenitus]|uniref:protein disulfide-isomerase n=1 Tax=Dacryopinax primogenitus (strain DJM 731) TaxID=1858805 RepID=M5G9B1_DACPD|nr:disulfide-isomerase precursor [Dacryopinax primogenitus]EJU04800.1 disulfide-isomerase precursor [Dacryopinax primogenitus]
MKFTYISLFAAFAATVLASNVLELESTTFDQHIGGDAPALVEFFAPWCGHCKNLAPVYEQLADAYSHTQKVIIAKVDADGAGKEAGARFGVTGFPTLKWFPAGSLEPEPYEGQRDLDALISFVESKSGVKAKGPPPPTRQILQSHDFDEVVMDPSKDVLVAFTAPWCGHCKNLKPTLEKVAQDFQSEPACVIAEFDADAATNKPIAGRYNVNSYPTIKFFPRGNDKVAEDYMQGRSEEQFVEFLNERCGTFRSSGGVLNSLAGRIPSLDSLASKFYSSIPDRDTLLKEASSAAAALELAQKTSGDYYLRVMNKVSESGEWLHKESARLASILQKKTLAPAKLDEIQRKANILASFVEEKLKEAADEAQHVFNAGSEKGAEATERVREEL